MSEVENLVHSKILYSQPNIKYIKYLNIVQLGNPSMCCSIHLCIPQLHTFLISQTILFLPSNPPGKIEKTNEYEIGELLSMKLVSY